MPISREKTRTNKYCLTKRMHKFREFESCLLGFFFPYCPTNVLDLVNLYFILYLQQKKKIMQYVYVCVCRHVKVSQPGSHGLAHHEPGSK